MNPTDFVPGKIIVHHSLTKDSRTVSWGAIRHYHTSSLGWTDIGYHAGVELVASGSQPYFEALFGRSWGVPGAHTRGQNHNSLGICFVGNYDEALPPEGMMRVGARVIALWLGLYSLSVEDVYGHHYFNIHKSCPGKNFNLEHLMTLAEDQNA